MHIKIRKQNQDGEIRLETKGAVREIRIKENFLHPRKEMIELCFRGQNTSGIVEFPRKEFESIAKEVQGRSSLIKSVRIIKEEA